MFAIIFCLFAVFVICKVVFSCRARCASLKKLAGKHVVVTGGSSGIGLHVGIHCVKNGADLSIIARNENRLKEAIQTIEKYRINSSQQIAYRVCDVSAGYEEVKSVLSTVKDPIDILINCAGFAICGVYEEVSVEDVKRMMDVNYYGSYFCCRYVLPKMKQRKQGIIVLTASQAALFGIYGYGPYSATKFALRGMAETLAMECRPFGVSVTLALPSDTDTPGLANEDKTKPKETKIISESGGLANPADVAKRILEDALTGSIFSIYGMESWIITILCCGMAPWGGPWLNALQIILMGPLRFVGCILQWNFSRIVERSYKEKEAEMIKQK